VHVGENASGKNAIKTGFPRNWESVTRSPDVEGSVKSGASAPTEGGAWVELDVTIIGFHSRSERMLNRFELSAFGSGEEKPPEHDGVPRREHDTCYLTVRIICALPDKLPRRDATTVREENLGGEENAPRVTPDMVEDWLRHAQLRAANLYYLAGDPSPAHRERALTEMTKALREALEEVRVVAEQLRRDEDLGQGKTRRSSPAARDQVISPPRPLERE
jgi:hypothetical protein